MSGDGVVFGGDGVLVPRGDGVLVLVNENFLTKVGIKSSNRFLLLPRAALEKVLKADPSDGMTGGGRKAEIY